MGSTSAADGMIKATSVRLKITLRPTNLPTTSPYPAGMAVSSVIAVALSEYRSEFAIQRRTMWLLKSSTCCHASQTLWRLPNANGLLLSSSTSVFVGASTSQASGTTKKTANASSTTPRTASAAWSRTR